VDELFDAQINSLLFEVQNSAFIIAFFFPKKVWIDKMVSVVFDDLEPFIGQVTAIYRIGIFESAESSMPEIESERSACVTLVCNRVLSLHREFERTVCHISCNSCRKETVIRSVE